MTTIIDLIQGSPAWLEFRRTHIGASDVSVIMGKNPWKTPYQLWLEKTGRKEERAPNAAMMRGTELEAEARILVSELLNTHLEPMVAVSKHEEWAMASLDGISLADGILVEIKHPNEETHATTAFSGVLPEYYMIQCQWQLYVVGFVEMKYFSRIAPKEYYFIELVRNNELIAEMVVKCKEFYDCMINDYPPEVTEKDYVFVEDESFRSLSRKYAEVHKRYEQAKQELECLKDALLNSTDDGNCENEHVRITRAVRKGNVDYPKLLSDLGVDEQKIQAYRKKAVQYTLITVRKGLG